MSVMPCDPPRTQEDDIRMDEGELVENINVSSSEREGKKTWGE